jgi:hypothetical protein
VRRAFGIKTLGVLVVAAAFWALPAKAMAVPVCGVPPEDIEDYSEGCTIDGLLFSDFLVVPSPGSPNNVDAMDSWVDGSTIYFQLNPNLFAGDDVLLYFRVSTLDGSSTITGVDLSNLGSSNSFITEGVCTVSWVNNTTCLGGGGSIVAFLEAGGAGGFDDAFFSGRSEIYILKDIGVPEESGHVSIFTQSFHHSVPDGGSTLAMLGLGLMGLRSLRRRFTGR